MKGSNTNIEIIPFRGELAVHFTTLNTAWLQKYFVVEPLDEQMLASPKEFFIDKGGFIFFAKVDEAIAGTFALLKEPGNIYELSKMAVDEKYQGMKIGNRMMEYCIAEANELKAAKIILYSNTKLAPAIHLYKKYGFIEVPVKSALYKRADIKMERALP